MYSTTSLTSRGLAASILSSDMSATPTRTAGEEAQVQAPRAMPPQGPFPSCALGAPVVGTTGRTHLGVLNVAVRFVVVRYCVCTCTKSERLWAQRGVEAQLWTESALRRICGSREVTRSARGGVVLESRARYSPVLGASGRNVRSEVCEVGWVSLGVSPVLCDEGGSVLCLGVGSGLAAGISCRIQQPFHDGDLALHSPRTRFDHPPCRLCFSIHNVTI